MRAVPELALPTGAQSQLDWCIDAIRRICRASQMPDTVTSARQELWIPVSMMTARVSSGAGAATRDSGSNDVTTPVFDFDQTAAEYVHFNWAPPKRWDRGTVAFIPYWTADAGSATQTCIFTLAGVAISNDDTTNATFGTPQSSSDALIIAGDLHVGPESSAITIDGSPAEADLVVFQLARNVADTLAADARLIGIKLIWSANADNDI